MRVIHRNRVRALACRRLFLILVASFLGAGNCFGQAAEATNKSWGERLGWPSDKRVLMLHADDIGMCYEANLAAKNYLLADEIQSAALMVPCPWYNEMAAWYREHPDEDLGLHLALTSEWRWYRWGPVTPPSKVPGLLDEEGYLHRNVRGVVLSASPEEVEMEIRAQIDRALKLGTKPGHIDTHMGTLYARPEFTAAYLKCAEEYQLPAMVIEMTPATVAKFREQGYPMNQQMIELIKNYKLPKLDDFYAAPNGDTYEQKCENFYQLVRNMRPGINEVIFHPSVESEALPKITGSWQQRIWEAKMFSDPEVKRFLEREGVEFTDWKEIMRRFKKIQE